MGGGGFMMEPDDSRLDAFLLELARERRGRERPNLGWIGTASADSLDAWLRCQAAFAGRAIVSRLTLFERTVEDIDAWSLDQDLIYVGGGNTASLLAVWRAHGVDRALAGAHEAGVVLAGLSAGAICWFEAGTTDSYGPTLQPLEGALGIPRRQPVPALPRRARATPDLPPPRRGRHAAGGLRGRRRGRRRVRRADDWSRRSRHDRGRAPSGSSGPRPASWSRPPCRSASCRDPGPRRRLPSRGRARVGAARAGRRDGASSVRRAARPGLSSRRRRRGHDRGRSPGRARVRRAARRDRPRPAARGRAGRPRLRCGPARDGRGPAALRRGRRGMARRSPTTGTRRTSWPSRRRGPRSRACRRSRPTTPSHAGCTRRGGSRSRTCGSAGVSPSTSTGRSSCVLLGGRWASFLAADDRTRVETRLDGLRGLARDPAAELLVAGRTSAASLAWLERTTEARTRALVEERGMRTRIAGQRPVASILGALLERDGAGSLGDHPGPVRRRRPRRQPRPARPSRGRRPRTVAVRRRPIRVGPAAP